MATSARPRSSRDSSSSRIRSRQGDIDGDDNLDLAVVHDASQDLRTYFGNGDGSFTASQIIPIDYFPTTSPPLSVIVTDMDDDGLIDVAVGTLFDIHVLINTGGGVLELESGFAVSSVVTGSRL